MLYFTYSINILLLFAIPIVIGIFLVRKFDLEGRWWWIGAIVYIISLIILTQLENFLINPFLNNISYSGALPSMEVLIFGSLLIGLSTALCEEILRYGMFRWWTKDARSFKSGLLLGTGFGGAASIFLAFMVLYNFILMSIFHNKDLANLVPGDQLQMLQSQISAFWSAPWYNTFREAFSQFFLLSIEICLTVLILQSFIRRQWYWILLAIGFHTLVETARIIAVNLTTNTWTNVVLGVLALFSVFILFSLRNSGNFTNKRLGALGEANALD